VKTQSPILISVSRRTDIPRYYSKWFINRIKEGYAQYKTPFSNKYYSVSLKPEDVHAIIFWTRNPKPLLPYLPLLERKYNFVFHFTITGAPKIFEGASLEKDIAIEIFKNISSKYGKERIFLRYDPIIISNISSSKFYIEEFERIIRKLKNYTTRCYFSFVDYYARVRRNIKKYLTKKGIYCYAPTVEEKNYIAKYLYEIAKENNIELFSCCEKEIKNIKSPGCIDGEYINKIFPQKKYNHKKLPTREGCNCTQSKDIGIMDTCPNRCIYCYATKDFDEARKNFLTHNENNAYLI
jgi:hypothetical protein